MWAKLMAISVAVFTYELMNCPKKAKKKAGGKACPFSDFGFYPGYFFRM